MPTKAAYLQLADAETGLEFEHFLAVKLGMTVRSLRGMSNAEFIRWQMYFARDAQERQLHAEG